MRDVICIITPFDCKGLRTLRTLDTSDQRQFGTMSLVPKCLTFFCQCRSVFGTLQHQCRSVSTFYEEAEVSVTALVPKCLGQIGGTFLFLYRFTNHHHLTSHLHHPSRFSDSVYQDIYEIIPDIHIWLITHFNNISLFPVHFSINYLGTWTMSMPPSARRGH